MIRSSLVALFLLNSIWVMSPLAAQPNLSAPPDAAESGICEVDPILAENDVIGRGIGATRSLACQRAQDDANGKCSNRACFGCDRLLACDCACLAGDFDRVCTAIGTACPVPQDKLSAQPVEACPSASTAAQL